MKKEDQMSKFEVGKFYRNYYSSVGDFRNFECIKRTAKTVTFRESESGKEFKTKAEIIGMLEYIILSDCVVYATDQVQD